MSENRKVRPLVTNRPHANDGDPRSIFYAATSRDLDPFGLQRRVIPYGCKRSDVDHGSRSAGVQGELQHDTSPLAEHLGLNYDKPPERIKRVTARHRIHEAIHKTTAVPSGISPV